MVAGKTPSSATPHPASSPSSSPVHGEGELAVRRDDVNGAYDNRTQQGDSMVSGKSPNGFEAGDALSISSPEAQSENEPRSKAAHSDRQPLDSSVDLGPLFNAEYYQNWLDKDAEVENLRRHYLEQGVHEGHSPHPLFSLSHYLDQAGDLGSVEPVTHFRQTGWKESLDPHPFFVTSYYLEQLGDQPPCGMDPLTHYLREGWKLGLKTHPWFWADYTDRQLSVSKDKTGAPMSLMIFDGLRRNHRPHPMFHPPQLSAFLRHHGRKINRDSLSKAFVEWPEDLDLSPSPLLDFQYYTSRYPESLKHPGGPFRHFMEVGAHGDYDPNPYFDSAFYRERYGRQLGGLTPFRHYILHEHSCRFDPCDAFSTSHYSTRTASLKRTRVSLLEHFLEQGRHKSLEIKPFKVPPFVRKQLREARRLEPELKLSRKLSSLGVYNRHQSVMLSTYFTQAEALIGPGFKIMVCVPYLARGGADLAATNLVRWLHEKYGRENVVLVMTDADRRNSVDWLPADTRMISFASIDPKMKRPDRQQLLQELILQYRPEAVYNVNSNIAWALYSHKGKALRQLTRLYAHLFCFDFDQYHRPIGYAMNSLPMAIQDLTTIYLDNDAFRQVLRTAFNFPRADKDKLRVLYQPLKPQGFQVDQERLLARLSRNDGQPKNVFWAGRLDPQKRPDLLLKIARQCPDQRFHVHGASVLGKDPFEGEEIPENMTLYGEYREFFELPLHEADMFLYTSAWDGLPLILIDMQQTGIPVIAPDVGGIKELVNNQTGFLISDFEDVHAYAKTIQDICSGKIDCRARLEAAQQKVMEQHHWTRYAATLEAGLAPAGGMPGPTIR